MYALFSKYSFQEVSLLGMKGQL